MSNCYALAAAESLIPCLKEEALEIERLVEEGLFIYAEENLCPDEISEETLTRIASLLKKANMPYVEIAIIGYSDHVGPGHIWGEKVRIHDDGSLEWAERTWPSEQKPKMNVPSTGE